MSGVGTAPYDIGAVYCRDTWDSQGRRSARVLLRWLVNESKQSSR